MLKAVVGNDGVERKRPIENDSTILSDFFLSTISILRRLTPPLYSSLHSLPQHATFETMLSLISYSTLFDFIYPFSTLFGDSYYSPCFSSFPSFDSLEWTLCSLSITYNGPSDSILPLHAFGNGYNLTFFSTSLRYFRYLFCTNAYGSFAVIYLIDFSFFR